MPPGRGVASHKTLWVTKINENGGCQWVTKFYFLMVDVSEGLKFVAVKV